MIDKKDLKQISEVVWEISSNFKANMKVPARIFASHEMLADILKDRSLEQIVNVATLPGIRGKALAMPDIHEGYGFPIGGVAATSFPDGAISPGGIGYDINCGARLLISKLFRKDSESHISVLASEIYRAVPSGIGQKGRFRFNDEELNRVLENGINWAVKAGYAETREKERIESFGKLTNADPETVSITAKNRGRNQLGTLGAGNHFVEVGFIEKIFNPEIAEKSNLRTNQITILIHTGSRGLGHQVATDYIKIMLKSMSKYKITLPDRELACAPFSSKEGTDYFNAMAAAANFAWANRQLIVWEIRNEWKRFFSHDTLETFYDVAHNIAKIEEHLVAGKLEKVIVHRKGATRAFGPGHKDLPLVFKETGQPVLVPGSMGTSSYILAGTGSSMEESFGSACHGAGRRMSRHQAKKEIKGITLKEQLQKKGITVIARNVGELPEEAPFAYKDIENVVEVLEKAGIAKKIARLKPLIVIKG